MLLETEKLLTIGSDQLEYSLLFLCQFNSVIGLASEQRKNNRYQHLRFANIRRPEMTSSGSFPSKARHCDTANSQLPGLMASDLKAVIILKLEDNKFSIKYTLSFLPVFSSHFHDSLSRFFPVKFLNCKAGCKDVSLNQRLLFRGIIA